MISVEIETVDPAWSLALPDAEALVLQAAREVQGDGEAAIVLADDEMVRRLNGRFRGQDRATNVLSFPAGPNPLGHLGDVALAYGVCARQAADQGKPLADHVRHLVVHGLLHLLGYDHQDETEGDVMEALERTILSGMGVPDPYGDAGQD